MGSPVSAVIANLYREVFDDQAIESAPYKPNIWKGYVDDTFAILDRSNGDSFLHHLNSQQPTIRFTMETEKDIMIAFPFLTHKFRENRTAALPPVSTENQLTLISTWRMIHTTLNQ